MLIYIFTACGALFLGGAAFLIFIQQYRIERGYIVVDESYNGPEQVSVTVHTIIRFLLKRSVHFRKFCTQYFFHMIVRFMYHFDIWTTKMYSRSRNWFVKNAVQNKGTVPHFWQHLKVYKQEMDQEREQEEEIK